MKLRSQRTHFMGSSNRSKNIQQSKTASVFQRSFNKSKSLYYKTGEQTSIADLSQRKNPFLGSHNEFQTHRFDKLNVKPYKQTKMTLAPTQKIIQYSGFINKEVDDIKREFKGKKINMHKLYELKKAFVKNNRQKRDLKSSFQKYLDGSDKITARQMKRIVKQYGFDVNEDESKLIIKLTNRKDEHQNDQGLDMGGFVDLMTKDDIYYKTLKINNIDESEGQVHNFSQKTHTILRNKFVKLKEAFKIYRSRGEEVDEQRFNYVMKKMDITNLIMGERQRNQIFQRFSTDGTMNVQGLICAIAQQQYGKKMKVDKNLDFIDDLRVNEENQQYINNKLRKFSLKSLSSLQYENQLFKAQKILSQLRRLSKQEQKNIINCLPVNKDLKRSQIVKNTEKFLKGNGINFNKDQYDAFSGYLDFDKDDSLSKNALNRCIFEESQKQARQRFERKIRNEAPKMNSPGDHYYDEQTAGQSIRRLKDHKLNPQNKELFKYFDKDKDGYISTSEFAEGLSKLQIFQNWQVNNLVSYFDSDKKGSIQYDSFTNKMHRQEKQELPLLRSKQSVSCRQWSGTKKSFVNSFNQASYQKPTKYSAWPKRLTQTDLSLIQPPSNTGMHASINDRFIERKQDYGAKQKQKAHSIAEARVQKLANWNNKLAERIDASRKVQENRVAANNYFKRLTQEAYQERCHK